MVQLQLFVIPQNYYSKTKIIRIDSESTLGALRDELAKKISFNHTVIFNASIIGDRYSNDTLIKDIGIRDNSNLYIMIRWNNFDI